MGNIHFSYASGVADSVFGKCLNPLKLFVEAKAEAYEQKSILPLLFNMETSDRYGESATSMTSMRGPQPVGEAGDYPYDGFREGYRKFVEHMTWKDLFEITREAVDDEKTLDLKSAPTAYMKAWERTRERYGIRVFAEAILGNASFQIGRTTFDATTADEQTLFSQSHPSITGEYAAQSNLFADAFSDDALGAMECAMQGFCDDNGVELAVSPTTILIPNDYALKKAVFAAIGADKDPSTANNGFNYQFGRWNVIVSQYLNGFLTVGLKPWVLLDSNYNQEVGCANWYDREPMNFEVKIADNDNLQHKGRARWSHMLTDWRFCAVGGITGGTQLIPTT